MQVLTLAKWLSSFKLITCTVFHAHQMLQRLAEACFVLKSSAIVCRPPHSRRRQRPVAARSNEVATVAAAALADSPSPATLQPDGTTLSAPSSSRDSAVKPRQLRGREVEERALDCCIQMHQDHPHGLQMPSRFGTGGLDEAYERCGVVTASYAKTFYLGTQLMTPEKAKAVWAVYVWCRRTDELVDGPNASRITPEVIF